MAAGYNCSVIFVTNALKQYPRENAANSIECDKNRFVSERSTEKEITRLCNITLERCFCCLPAEFKDKALQV